MNLLQSGVDLTVIRLWLGHASLDTTHHYLEAILSLLNQGAFQLARHHATSAPYRQKCDELTRQRAALR
jgi:site-specific recombinase XerD